MKSYAVLLGVIQAFLAIQATLGKAFSLPYVIAHRGDYGEFPEHVAPGYLKAIEEGADFIDCDVVPTEDCVLICRHEPNLNLTTDAARYYSDYAGTANFYGTDNPGIYSFNLTWDQISKLVTRQDVPGRNNTFNGLYGVVTLEEFIDIAREADRTVGVYVETKHPTFFDSLKLPCFAGGSFSEAVLNTLLKKGYTGPINSESWNTRPAFLASFERQNLKDLFDMTSIPLTQMMGGWSTTPENENITYGEMASASGLKEIARYAAAVAAWKDSYVTIGNTGWIDKVNVEFVENVHAAGLQLHAWVFRDEARYLARDFSGNVDDEYALQFNELGIDGAFTDQPATLVEYLDESYSPK